MWGGGCLESWAQHRDRFWSTQSCEQSQCPPATAGQCPQEVGAQVNTAKQAVDAAAAAVEHAKSTSSSSSNAAAAASTRGGGGGQHTASVMDAEQHALLSELKAAKQK